VAVDGRRDDVPDRIAWAMEIVSLEPGQRVLEFGCGPGVAASLAADRLAGGCITAIDRSSTAVSRAAQRCAAHVASGRVALEHVSLAEFRSDTRFDTAFGVNVNVFWTTPADAECRVLTDVLVPGGAVHLVYEGPRHDDRRIIDGAAAALTRHGFTVATRRRPAGSLVCISGRRPR
jgi:cyclopropane fatty-acyl-phospholipid synthase-like methyltransferase